jgi:hypothetical protein
MVVLGSCGRRRGLVRRGLGHMGFVHTDLDVEHMDRVVVRSLGFQNANLAVEVLVEEVVDFQIELIDSGLGQYPLTNSSSVASSCLILMFEKSDIVYKP